MQALAAWGWSAPAPCYVVAMCNRFRQVKTRENLSLIFTARPVAEPVEPRTDKPANWWFTLPASEVAAFAGIWRPSEWGNVFSFLTCEPNPLVAPLHPKAMPVILDPADYEGWLDGTFDDACALAVPFPSQLMAVA